MYISGTDITPFNLYRFKFKPKTDIALQWHKVSNGNWVAVDRGAEEDIYKTELYIYGTEAEINNFISELEANRSGETYYFTLSNFNEIDDQIFGADIDYSGSLDVTVIDWSKRKQKQFKSYTLQLTLQLIEYPYPYTGTPSLPTLKPLIGYTGDNEYSVEKIDSYDNSFTYIDQNKDTGIFEASFIFNHTDMNAFRRYLMSTIRGSSMSISSIAGVAYPFGVNRGGYPISVKVLDFIDELLNINFWSAKLKLAEET